MYSDTITLFNRKRQKSGDTWYATVLRGVDLNADKAAVVEKYGATSKDAALLHVKFAIQEGGIAVGGKPYYQPKAWQALENPAEAITFTDGESFDFFWDGEWDGETEISDDAYGIDGLYDYMNRARDGVYAISSAARYSVIPHFEIVGK